MVIMKNALWKDIFRDIKKSKGRFISIVSIIALGVMLFIGVKIAPIDMKATADKYYDDYNLMDLRIISTLGLTDKDVEEIKNINGILGVSASNSIDVLSKIGSDEFVLKVNSIPNYNLNANNEDYINRLKTIEGRLPEKSGECVIGNENFKHLDLKIGDKIILKSGTEEDITYSLVSNEYEVVGVVETPYYLSDQIGSSNIGNGNIEDYIFIKQSDFKSDVYTDIYVTIDGTKKLNSYKNKYFNLVNEVKDSIKNIESIIIDRRYNEIKDVANEELINGKKEYENKKLEAERKLKEAEDEIENTKLQLISAETELNNKEAELKDTFEEAEGKISNGEIELAQKETEYKQGLATFNEGKESSEQMLEKAEASIKESENYLNLLIQQRISIEESLNNENINEEETLKLKGQLEYLTELINRMVQEIDTSKLELQSKKNELDVIEENLNYAKEQIEQTRNTLNVSREQLELGKSEAYSQLEAARREIDNGKEKLLQGEEEYKRNKELAEEELAKAEEKIKEAENEISKIEKPVLYILDRKSHYSYVDYENSANSIDKLSNVFPVFFFVVAALVCLTTMTRMVDEQRINIGTMKALGYGKGSIAKKFIVYALFASLFGCIAGTVTGLTILPLVIFNAYNILYLLPKMVYIINIPLIITVFLVAIGVTTISTYAACRIELVETPAMLMRPKAPKEGKRILIERVPFIWNRLNFIGKVTIRNIFRYKKRFLMTVIGIAGSTALLLAGFGIKDSIKTVVNKQFGSITKYEISANLNNNFSGTDKGDLENYLNNSKSIADYLFVRSEGSDISANDDKKEVKLIVTSNPTKFDDFIHLQNRVIKEDILLPIDGIAITEKIAKQLSLKVGDEIEITNSNGITGTAKIGVVVENYINHYIYMESSYYEKVFGKNANTNEVLIKLSNIDKADEVSNNLVSLNGIAGVVNNANVKNNFADTIKSLDFVILVMIFCAGALSFIVLYNLTNVNISERIREIATIKVLGFYDKEVSAYIFRENILLTIIGLVCGLLLGIIFHRFIMVTVEMDYVMFGRVIDIKSFIYSTILTIVFSFLVNWAMYFKLKNVEMVESLKSVD